MFVCNGKSKGPLSNGMPLIAPRLVKVGGEREREKRAECQSIYLDVDNGQDLLMNCPNSPLPQSLWFCPSSQEQSLARRLPVDCLFLCLG